CYDISHTMGTEIVASMVVMEDGLAKRSDYRRFKIRSLTDQDDFASMTEVLTRRFTNYLRERDEGVRAGKRFSYPPNLVLIDGGKGQLSAEELLAVPWLPDAVGRRIYDRLHSPSPPARSPVPAGLSTWRGDE